MLVQAKRLKRDKSGWRLDVSHGGGLQRRNLLDAADFLDVPAIYGIYMGGLVFRRDLACTHGGMSPCLTCKRMAITMMPALSLSPDWSQEALAAVSFAEGIPLEDLGDPDKPAGFVRDVNFRELEPGDLRTFLTDDQVGPREVAKHIFKSISTRRSSQHSAAVAERLELAGEQVFSELPRDRGHFPVAYFPHILRGLRRTPPDYLQDIIAGFPPPPELSQLAAGVVLVVD